MSPFDLVLMCVGAMLTLVGVYLFASGKMIDKASKVEAFGIKLDVTNPSLILILAGVGLMLAPRLLPEQLKPEPPAPEVVQAPAPGPAAPIPDAPSAPSPTVPDTPATAPAPASHKTAAPAPTQPAPPRTARASAPLPAQPEPAPRPSGAATKPITKPFAKPADSTPPSSPLPTATAPAATPAPVRAAPATPKAPVYLVAARGSPDKWKGFWENEEAEAYSQKLVRRGAERLRRIGGEGRAETLSDQSSVSSLMDNNTLRQERCKVGGFSSLAIFTVAPPQVVISRVESAYWPELTLVIHDCRDGTARREVRQLAPRNTDRFPFESDLVDYLDRIFKDRL